MRIEPLFKWYDIWIGLFIDEAKLRLYFFPVPMIGLCFHCTSKGQVGTVACIIINVIAALVIHFF
jgi:hypothetical protein